MSLSECIPFICRRCSSRTRLFWRKRRPSTIRSRVFSEKNGVEILYQEDMFAQAMKNESERSAFVEEFLDRSAIPSIGLRDRLAEYYNGLPLDEFVERVYTGVLKSEFDGGIRWGLLRTSMIFFSSTRCPTAISRAIAASTSPMTSFCPHMGKPLPPARALAHEIHPSRRRRVSRQPHAGFLPMEC